MSQIKLNQTNQKATLNSRVNFNTSNAHTTIKDNDPKQDTFINSHKHKVIAGGILGTVVLAFGIGALAYKGKLGTKAQELVGELAAKITKIFNSDPTKPMNIEPAKPVKPTNVKIEPQGKIKPVEEVKSTAMKAADKIDAIEQQSPKAEQINIMETPVQDIIQPKQAEIKEKVIQETIDTGLNPKAGDNLNLANTNNFKTIDLISEDANGEYIKYSITLDESPDLYTGKVITGGRLYNEYRPDNDAARARMYTPNHELPDDWLEAYNIDYEFASEAIKKKYPTLKSYAEYMSNPKKLQDIQLQKLLKNTKSTQQEYYLYRGVNLSTMPQQYNEMLQNAKIGDTIIPDWGVSCVAPDPAYAINHYTGGGYKNTALLRIKTPVGSKLLGLQKDGFTEYHMPSMSEYKFAAKHRIGNLMIYDLDYIMPNLNKV